MNVLSPTQGLDNQISSGLSVWKILCNSDSNVIESYNARLWSLSDRSSGFISSLFSSPTAACLSSCSISFFSAEIIFFISSLTKGSDFASSKSSYIARSSLSLATCSICENNACFKSSSSSINWDNGCKTACVVSS